jgi:hypothetical protein
MLNLFMPYGEMFRAAEDEPVHGNSPSREAIATASPTELNNSGDPNGFKPAPRKTTPELTADSHRAWAN